jgi:hypothetical protein
VFSRHCSDAQLLAYLDGELSAWERVRVQAHLDACWACRGRREGLEKQAQAFAAPFESGGLFGPDWATQARKRFVEWRDRTEAASAPRPSGPVNRRMLPSALALAAGLACIAVVGYEFLGGETGTPTASQVIAKVRRAEAELERQGVHQVFRVEAAEIRPSLVRRTGKIEVWSDSPNGRYASRWVEGDDIRYATWRPSAGREVVRNGAPPAEGQGPVRLDVSSVDASVIEHHFLRWLETRRWRPIALGDHVAAFVSEDGVVVRAERPVLADGRRILRLVARRQKASVAAELLFEVDEATHSPRLFRVRLDSADRSVELVLAAEKAEKVGPGGFPAAVFEPEVPQRASVPPPPRPDFGGLRAGAIAAPGPAALEIQAYYALHRARGCLGEAIEVVPQPGGRVTIRGFVQEAARREEIAESVRGLAFADLEIRTYEEAMREIETRPEPASAPPAPDIEVRGSQMPAEEAVRRRLAAQSGENLAAAAADYANQAVSEAGRLLTHTWALKRLADAFPPERTRGLSPAIAWLLEAMVRDHAEAAADALAESLDRMEPVLRELTGAEAFNGAAAGAGDWREASRSLHARAEAIARLTRTLFTVSGASAEPTQELADALWKELAVASGGLALSRWTVELAGNRLADRAPARPLTHDHASAPEQK